MELVELGKVFKISSGGTPSRRKTEYYKDGNIPWVKTGDLKPKYINKAIDYITEEGLNNSSAKLFPKETVLIAMYGATIGATSILEIEASTNQACAAFLPTDKCTPLYLYYFFKGNQTEIIRMGVGGAQPNISAGLLKRVKIPLPPLETQKRIAAILDEADKLRQLNQQLIQKYDALTQSLFLDMFGDPVTNPKGWEKVKFNEVGKLDRGKSKHRPRNAPELLGGKYPLIQTGDIANSGGYITEYKSTYSEIGLAQSRMWESGTLCITIAANIAKTGILTFDACFPDSVVGFLPNEKTNAVFTQFWISFLQKILEDSAPESAQKNINLSILRDLDFLNPPIHLQTQFAERVQLIEAQKAQAQTALQKSDALFNSLLQKAFKGAL
ncbi:restriction endonuclease subunit S [Gelatiniphilus marinus]|uniref:Restriction endonuclease subunit S n=1 Tax=Gelatiniphilus marinus TaxID=1759464 RepID=A0ABW5JWU6_9FLAO